MNKNKIYTYVTLIILLLFIFYNGYYYYRFYNFGVPPVYDRYHPIKFNIIEQKMILSKINKNFDKAWFKALLNSRKSEELRSELYSLGIKKMPSNEFIPYVLSYGITSPLSEDMKLYLTNLDLKVSNNKEILTKYYCYWIYQLDNDFVYKDTQGHNEFKENSLVFHNISKKINFNVENCSRIPNPDITFGYYDFK